MYWRGCNNFPILGLDGEGFHDNQRMALLQVACRDNYCAIFDLHELGIMPTALKVSCYFFFSFSLFLKRAEFSVVVWCALDIPYGYRQCLSNSNTNTQMTQLINDVYFSIYRNVLTYILHFSVIFFSKNPLGPLGRFTNPEGRRWHHNRRAAVANWFRCLHERLYRFAKHRYQQWLSSKEAQAQGISSRSSRHWHVRYQCFSCGLDRPSNVRESFSLFGWWRNCWCENLSEIRSIGRTFRTFCWEKFPIVWMSQTLLLFFLLIFCNFDTIVEHFNVYILMIDILCIYITILSCRNRFDDELSFQVYLCIYNVRGEHSLCNYYTFGYIKKGVIASINQISNAIKYNLYYIFLRSK